jgi:ribulose-5-phosphate 4-epimerase/fuculose-1-phosphate aldolase
MVMTAFRAGEKFTCKGRVSDAEWERRVDLAACYRLADLYGWTDLTATHFSAAVPGEEDTFLLNPFPMFFDQVRASDLIKVDFDGRILSETNAEMNAAGFTIHSAIHMARPDAQCIMHTHTVSGMAISALDCGLLPMTQHALLFHRRIGYHAYEGIADDLDERRRLVRDLGQHGALILRNHGLLTCGISIANAFKIMFYLEKSCEAQLVAMAAGQATKIRLPPVEVCDHAADQYAKFPDFGASDWVGHLRKLDRLDPSFRT